jgi:hypothetical protein
MRQIKGPTEEGIARQCSQRGSTRKSKNIRKKSGRRGRTKGTKLKAQRTSKQTQLRPRTKLIQDEDDDNAIHDFFVGEDISSEITCGHCLAMQ